MTFSTPDPHPVVSVIIPVFNGEPYLADAIDSVLAQTYRHLEIIVVDDGSTDGSTGIARRYCQVQCIHQTHAGLGEALNNGVRNATGSYIASLDADDLWAREKTALQMEALAKNPSLDIAFGHVMPFHSPELDAPLLLKNTEEPKAVPGYCRGAMLTRRESLQRVGRFATAWKIGDFIDWYFRACELGLRSMMLSQIVLRRRLHSGNMGIRERASRNDYVRIVKAALDRRREKKNHP